jgi:predicted TIM-barrel fold metal-dependent hydrolase
MGYTPRVGGLKFYVAREPTPLAAWLSVSGMLSSFRSRITVHALALVGPDRILFGSDIPWVPEFAVAGSAKGLATYAKLDEAGRAMVERRNALQFVPSTCRNERQRNEHL